ncbi:Xan family putative trans-acting RiPP leader peptide [Myxococcus stipitatus]|uniref:Xan family putative trans-acting RiPP leader peptide n=1 Tax=Myxococcus stipitatus TaxID=83455 RepID=UPI0030D15C35
MAEEAPRSSSEADVSVASTPASTDAEPPALEKLDEIEEIDFLLQEIESKIAPLALA